SSFLGQTPPPPSPKPEALGMGLEHGAVQSVAHFVASMELTRPDILRAVPAYMVLEYGGAALRRSGGDFYGKSRMAEKIQNFWSHSWHGNVWHKYSTLLVLNNGPAAMLLATLAAILAAALFSCGLLPGFHRLPYGWGEIQFSAWSLGLGALVAAVTFVLWRNRKKVFLDRLCINQVDGSLKAEAICSLAGVLDKSDSMLVLWDTTFAKRLWCVFELAAFLKSKQRKDKLLVVTPTLVGPCSVLAFLSTLCLMIPYSFAPADGAHDARYVVAGVAGVGLGIFICLAELFRKFYRSVEDLRKQLSQLQLAETRCTCCSVEHRGPAGSTLLCDKKVITECISQWFGSTQAFEHYVHTEVCNILTDHLEHESFSSMSWCLSVASPALWANMDLMSQSLRRGDWPAAARWLILGLACVLQVAPILVTWTKFLTRRFRARASTRARDAAVSALIMVLLLLCLCVVVARLNANH
ncbi:unnamed protein product, partial [Effrenium voratum]